MSVSKSEELLLKAEGVADCVKWLRVKIKESKKEVESAKKLYRSFGMYDDCGESYSHDLLKSQAKLEEQIAIKISLKKYVKKLRHEASELNG